MTCRSGFYPDREIATLYVCMPNNKWTDPGQMAKLPLPDCLCKCILYWLTDQAGFTNAETVLLTYNYASRLIFDLFFIYN